MKGKIERFVWDDREVIMYLPPSYGQETDRYFPALLVQDGGYLFLESIEKIEQDTAEEKTEEIVFIGIKPFDRDTEYTPWKMEGPDGESFGGGNAEEYLEMLTSRLLPHLRRHYRISNDRTDTGTAGASFGGLVSLYSLFAKHNYFGKYCLISPSLWYEGFIEYIEQHLPIEQKTKVFMYVGEKEGINRPNMLRQMVPNNKVAYALLRKKLIHEMADIAMLTDPDGEHLHSYFTEYFPAGVRFLYPKKPTEQKGRE